MVDFRLRPMEPRDGPAMDALLRHEPQTTSVQMSTHYRGNVFEAFVAQHPTAFGVVAEAPGEDGLVGMATAFLDEVGIGGSVYPSAHLENLKVHHGFRRQGLGARLAAWRIEEARRGFGRDGVIATGIEGTNTASIATARRWATQVVGPVRIVIGRTTSKPAAAPGYAVRPMAPGEVDRVVDGLNSFHAGYDMFPHQTQAKLAAAIGATAAGEPIRAYRVAVGPGGRLFAGASVTERFKLMTDHIDSMPMPIALLGRISGFLPADRVIRSIEVGLAWHAPDRVDALRAVWDAVRHEWHDRANTVVGLADPRGTLIQAFHVGRSFAPNLELVAPVQSPVPLADDRLLYMWR